MFEKYTEKARRVIFFSRHEASAIGGHAIEPEHILLGLLREDLDLFRQLMPANADLAGEVSAIRSAVEAAHPSDEKVSASVDLPLSRSAKQVLLYAAEASHGMGHRHIGTEHLLVGLFKDEASLASRILRERGLRLGPIEKQITGGSVTPELKNDAPDLKSFTQLDALVEMLIRRGVFTRQEFQEELARRYVVPELQSTIRSLLDLLLRKGVINENDRREIVGE